MQNEDEYTMLIYAEHIHLKTMSDCRLLNLMFLLRVPFKNRDTIDKEYDIFRL